MNSSNPYNARALFLKACLLEIAFICALLNLSWTVNGSRLENMVLAEGPLLYAVKLLGICVVAFGFFWYSPRWGDYVFSTLAIILTTMACVYRDVLSYGAPAYNFIGLVLISVTFLLADEDVRERRRKLAERHGRAPARL